MVVKLTGPTTIAGIETAHLIRKGQIADNGAATFQTFVELAA